MISLILEHISRPLMISTSMFISVLLGILSNVSSKSAKKYTAVFREGKHCFSRSSFNISGSYGNFIRAKSPSLQPPVKVTVNTRRSAWVGVWARPVWCRSLSGVSSLPDGAICRQDSYENRAQNRVVLRLLVQCFSVRYCTNIGRQVEVEIATKTVPCTPGDRCFRHVEAVRGSGERFRWCWLVLVEAPRSWWPPEPDALSWSAPPASWVCCEQGELQSSFHWIPPF